MRPSFLERFVLNCPFCRFNDSAVSCHVSQVPVVSVAGLAGAATIRSLWGRVALELPRQASDACRAPELDGKRSPELSPVILPSPSCCFTVSGSCQHPSASASVKNLRTLAASKRNDFHPSSQTVPPNKRSVGPGKANRLLKG